MLKNRYFISYFSTTLLYVGVTGLFLYLQQQTKVSTQRSEEKVMQVMLSDFIPEILPVEKIPITETPMEETPMEEPPVEKVIETPIEPEEIKEPVPEKMVEVVEEKIPEPVITPKPKMEKPKKKTEVKKVIEKRKPKQVVKNKKPEKQKPVKQASRASSKKMQANRDKVNQFYKKIRVKINQNKSYPKIAKRRRMQGTVKVTFTVLRNGKVGNIRIKGPKVFHNSARHAVKSAFPISVKDIPVSLPETVNVILQYQIR